MLLKDIEKVYPATYEQLKILVVPDIKFNHLLTRLITGLPYRQVVTTSEEKLAKLQLRKPIFTICERMLTLPEKFSYESTGEGVVFIDSETGTEFPFDTWCGSYYKTAVTASMFNKDEMRLLGRVLPTLHEVLSTEKYVLQQEASNKAVEKIRKQLVENYKNL